MAEDLTTTKRGNAQSNQDQLLRAVAVLLEKMNRAPTVQTALTRTVVENDDDTLVYCTNVTSTTVTLLVMEAGSSVAFIQGVGAGPITFEAGAGVTLLVDGAGDLLPVSKGVGSLVVVTWVTDTVAHITGSLEAA